MYIGNKLCRFIKTVSVLNALYSETSLQGTLQYPRESVPT